MNRQSIAIPLGLIGVTMMMVIPVSPRVLDMFLAVNITLAIVVLLSVMMLRDSLELSVFPSLLLMTTLVRLALNVSSTRLILTEADAGKVIETFGGFVIGSSVIVGLVVFLILVVIQFIVITNGATRVAEVAARFTLDAMPGKQMAIDADLGSGLLDEDAARKARERIAREADFYGAMDGASKFVKGDAIASMVIVVINLIGGFAIGMGSRGLALGEAADTYALLSVGDGLVSQIPALLISIATGLLVTRVGSSESMGNELGLQLRSPRVLRMAAAAVGLLGLLPGLPKLPFFGLAVVLYVLSTRPAPDVEAASPDEETAAVTVDPDAPEVIVEEMRVEPLELRLAYDILDLFDPAQGGDLLERVKALRRQIALDLGIVMPFVRSRDGVNLPPSTYAVYLRGALVGQGIAPRDQVMALPVGNAEALRALGGTETVEPVFGLEAFWIPEGARSTAANSGATVVDRSAAIVTHLAEVVRRNAGSLLTRQDVQTLVDSLRYDEPILANEVGSDVLPLGLVHEVLRHLLAERVSIRDLGPILEAISLKVTETRSVDALVAAARATLGRAIVADVSADGQLGAITLDPMLEGRMYEGLRELDGAKVIVVDPRELDAIGRELEAAMTEGARRQLPVALVVGQQIRAPLRKTIGGMGFDIPVLAYPELPQDLKLEPIAAIGANLADQHV